MKRFEQHLRRLVIAERFHLDLPVPTPMQLAEEFKVSVATVHNAVKEYPKDTDFAEARNKIKSTRNSKYLTLSPAQLAKGARRLELKETLLSMIAQRKTPSEMAQSLGVRTTIIYAEMEWDSELYQAYNLPRLAKKLADQETLLLMIMQRKTPSEMAQSLGIKPSSLRKRISKDPKLSRARQVINQQKVLWLTVYHANPLKRCSMCHCPFNPGLMYHGRCKECNAKRANQWYHKNPEVARQRARQSRILHPESYRQSQQKWRAKNQEKLRQAEIAKRTLMISCSNPACGKEFLVNPGNFSRQQARGQVGFYCCRTCHGQNQKRTKTSGKFAKELVGDS